MQHSVPAGWLAFTGREFHPLDRDVGFQFRSTSLLPPIQSLAWRNVNLPWRHFLGSYRKDLVDWCGVAITARAFRAWPKRPEYRAARERCVAEGTFSKSSGGDKIPRQIGFVSSRMARTRRKPQFRVIRGGKPLDLRQVMSPCQIHTHGDLVPGMQVQGLVQPPDIGLVQFRRAVACFVGQQDDFLHVNSISLPRPGWRSCVKSVQSGSIPAGRRIACQAVVRPVSRRSCCARATPGL